MILPNKFMPDVEYMKNIRKTKAPILLILGKILIKVSKRTGTSLLVLINFTILVILKALKRVTKLPKLFPRLSIVTRIPTSVPTTITKSN